MVTKPDSDGESGKALRTDETEKATLDQVLAGRDLIELFTPRRRVTALLDELRRNPSTRAILDGVPPSRQEPVEDVVDDHQEPPAYQQPQPAPEEYSLAVLVLVVNYAMG